MRNFITLLERNLYETKVWMETTKELASDFIDGHFKSSSDDLGRGLYVSDKPSETGDIVLEYQIKDDANILDLGAADDKSTWDKISSKYIDNVHLWKLMKRRGIDGAKNSELICIYNPSILKFNRVYCGVINDPLDQTDINKLDEIALGGLQRCTAVTVNSLLNAFGLRPITISEVPVDNLGVLNILTQHGLAYKPFPDAAGKTLQQFVNTHSLYNWYILTPGHALALIGGELFDAENKGLDGRKIQAAFQITKR